MITREEQLKYCSVCRHRAIGPDYETICKLTNAKADFDPTCPKYDFDDNVYNNNSSYTAGGGGSSWRIVLGAIVFVIAIVRLGMTCNRMNERSSNRRSAEQLETMIDDIKSRNNDLAQSFPEDVKQELGMELTEGIVEKNIDNFMTFRVPGQWYIIENITNDTNRLVIRDTRNYMATIAKIPLSKDIMEDWKTMRHKASNLIVKSTVSYTPMGEDLLQYRIQNSLMTINGCAKIYKDSKYAYIFQCEHFSLPISNVRKLFDQMTKECIILKK